MSVSSTAAASGNRSGAGGAAAAAVTIADYDAASDASTVDGNDA